MLDRLSDNGRVGIFLYYVVTATDVAGQSITNATKSFFAPKHSPLTPAATTSKWITVRAGI
jgi:hypothetical protein